MPRPTPVLGLMGSLVFACAARGQEAADLAERFGRLPATLIAAKKTDAEILDAMCLAMLVRLPKDHEKAGAKKHFQRFPNRREAVDQLLWAFMNTKEFATLHRIADLSPDQAKQFHERLARAMREK